VNHPIAAALSLALLCAGALAQTPLTTEVVASGLQKPVWAGQPPGDTTRLFVVQQHEADVVIVDLVSGGPKPAPFLDLVGKVQTNSGERGLLGMAFDPDYASTGHVFVFYTRLPDSALVVERYTVMAGNPDQANPSSGVVVLGPISHPDTNHNGGHIAFGPDGKLYVGIGDGGGDGDTGPGHVEPGGNSQTGLSPLGKLLRINKNGTVPGDNPFVGNSNYLPHVWATGLRNPWRYAFDSLTGDLWIADVGENLWEEIDFVPGGSGGGQNFGWRCMEAFDCTGLGGCTCDGPALQMPIQSYGHTGGKCSITGGVVYRGDAIPDLAGTYFYADYCSFQVFSLRFNGTAVTEFQERTAELETPGFPQIQWVASFSEDANGEIYIIDQNDEVFRVIPAGPFTGLGHALPGSLGAPVLHGEGPLTPGSPGSLELASARPSAASMLFTSVGVGPGIPFKGGTVMAVPYVLGLSLPTSPAGTLNLNWSSWPGGLPSGLSLCFQYAILDPAALWGVSLSNALRADLP
jgi:glucose/arabinose dehydrogenase